MTNELRQVIDKIIELSKTTTLSAHYSNDVIKISFAITDELTLTEQSSGDSFSIWFSVEGLATPTETNLKYSEIRSAEFITEEVMHKRSNGESNMAAMEIKLVDGSELTIFEDVA